MRIFCIVLMTGAIFTSASCVRAALVNGIAVIVNDAIVTYQDVYELIAGEQELLERRYATQPEIREQKISKLKADKTEQLVERQLILLDFKTAGYNLPETIIDDAIQDRIRSRYGDRATLTKSLRAQGITIEAFRQQMRENIIVNALQAKNISSEIIISPHKIEMYYVKHRDEFKVEEQVKLRMIVLNRTASSGEDAARKRAQEILSKIDEGAAFAEMATVYSEGSQSKQGGDWGWVERSTLRKELADVAFPLKPGQHSGVIETPEAYYLMLVEDRRPAHTKSLGEVRDEIEKNLKVEEQARLQKKWIDRLRKKTFVSYF